ncbi:MAG: DinB family protein [Actinomycetota bacterium]
MDEILLEAFRHSAWANKQLLAVCRGLTGEQLTIPGSAAGTDRDILAILNHIVQSDRGYAARRGDRPEWVDNEEDADTPDELERRTDENAKVWERFLSQPLEATKLVILDQGAYEAEQSMLVVQALHHGNAHREQICAVMTSLDVEPPDIQAWSYAEATGHARERTPEDQPEA